MILDFRNNVWKFQPQQQVTDTGDRRRDVRQHPDRQRRPVDVGGDLKLGTFNVLNYFTDHGEAASPTSTTGACTFFDDRAGNPIAVNTCTGATGPRGAADDANLAVSRPRS